MGISRLSRADCKTTELSSTLKSVVSAEVEGTYDYFSRNHEILGMVGRIVVGRPGGPAEKPLGYGGREGRTPTFPRAKEVLEFVSSQEVVEKKLIRYPTREFGRRYPY